MVLPLVENQVVTIEDVGELANFVPRRTFGRPTCHSAARVVWTIAHPAWEIDTASAGNPSPPPGRIGQNTVRLKEMR